MLRTVNSLFFSAMCLVVVPSLQASETPAGPFDVVQSASDRIMAIVEDATQYVDEDPERYYDELLVVLDEVVDFSGFARGVMGHYASKSYYDSLSSEGKSALREQVKRFTGEIRVGLVRTYGKGLLVFGGSRVEVQRPEDEAGENNKSSPSRSWPPCSPASILVPSSLRQPGLASGSIDWGMVQVAPSKSS